MENGYWTVQTPATALVVIERSRFIGHCLEVEDELTAKAFIAKVRAEHGQANHNCFAYRIGAGKNPFEYFNDHGEPSGTAGKPILGAIQRLNLTNVAVVVTRYFGGKKLGVRGLIEAYGQSATAVLETAGSVLRIPTLHLELVCGYPEYASLVYQLQQIEATVAATDFTDVVTLRFHLAEAYRERLAVIQELFPFCQITEIEKPNNQNP